MNSRPNAIIDKETGKIIVQRPMPPITCLAFEGGGSRCAAYPGFYKVLHRSGLINDVQYISGSSGGAIVALAIALGIDPVEAEAIMMNLNMEKFMEGYHSWLASGGVWGLGKTLYTVWKSATAALSSGKDLLTFIEDIIEKQLGNRGATFRDLAALVEKQKMEGGNKYKYLYITATDLSIAIPECKTFSHETELDMPLALAVRASAAFPFALEPVRWKGHLFSDGGLIRNLPTKIFDDARFLSAGYGFTEKGANPSVLSIKVDTQDEINQVLWGILKEVDLTSASEVAQAVYNALAQNTDPQEIREARMTIALPDNNIAALEFSVNDAGKIDLISAAERESQNFVENYYQAAYEVKTYPTVLAWLDSLSLDEIDEVLIAYDALHQACLTEEAGVVTEVSAPDLRARDPNKPTSEEITRYQAYIESYFQYRRQKRRNPFCESIRDLPPCHVNLRPEINQSGWSHLIQKEMTEKLDHIQARIMYVRRRIEDMECEFNDFPTITEFTCLHDDNHFENIQALTGLSEYYKILSEEKKELKMKLGVYKHAHYHYPQENAQKYAAFLDKINPLLRSASLPAEIKAVLFEQFPIALFESCGYARKSIFMCDLHDEMDRRLYIIAALYFLNQYYKKSAEVEIYNDLYRQFVSADVLLPKNFKTLGMVLNKEGVGLIVDAYRIEELLHYFERTLNPKSQPVMMLDKLFGLDKLLKTKKITADKNAEQGTNMRHLVSTTSIFSSRLNLVRRSDSSGLALSTPRASQSLEDSHLTVQRPGSSLTEADSDDDKKPRWFFH